MEKLSAKKKLSVVKLYLSGLSHDEIATKTGVSKGAVGGIVAELKGGGFPDVADLADQVELLRELAIALKNSGLAPGQCGVGLAVLKRIYECELEVGDIKRWADILQLAGTEDKTKAFVATVYRIQDFLNETSLTLDEIDAKLLEMDTKAAELQPTLSKVDKKKEEIAELEKKREALAPVVDSLEQKYELLNPIVKDLQARQAELLKQIKQEEAITATTQAGLVTWAKENQKLAKAGFTHETLAEFNDKVRTIGARHHIPALALRERLLHELGILDKDLGLETKLKATRVELRTERKAVTLAKKEQTELRAANETLIEQKTALEASIKAAKDTVIKEIGEIVPAAKEMLNKFNGELRQGNDDILGTVQYLKDEAIEIGREVGRYEGIIEANQWLVQLQSMAKGEEGLEAMKVRTILLLLLRGAQPWMKCNLAKVGLTSSLPETLALLVMELERWRV